MSQGKINWRAVVLGGWAERADNRKKNRQDRAAKKLAAQTAAQAWAATGAAGGAPVPSKIALAIAWAGLGAMLAWSGARAAGKGLLAALAWLSPKGGVGLWVRGVLRGVWRLRGMAAIVAAIGAACYFWAMAAMIATTAPMAIVDWPGWERALAAKAESGATGQRSVEGDDSGSGPVPVSGAAAQASLAASLLKAKAPATDLEKWKELPIFDADRQDASSAFAREAKPKIPMWLFVDLEKTAPIVGAKSLSDCFDAGFCAKSNISFGGALAWVAFGRAPDGAKAFSASQREEIGALHGALWPGMPRAGTHWALFGAFFGLFAAATFRRAFGKTGVEGAAAWISAAIVWLTAICSMGGLLSILTVCVSTGAAAGDSGPWWVSAIESQRAQPNALSALNAQSMRWRLVSADAWRAPDRSADSGKPKANDEQIKDLMEKEAMAKAPPAMRSPEACEAAGLCARIKPPGWADALRAPLGASVRLELANPRDESVWRARVDEATERWSQVRTWALWAVIGMALALGSMMAFGETLRTNAMIRREAPWIARLTRWQERGAPMAERSQLAAQVRAGQKAGEKGQKASGGEVQPPAKRAPKRI